MEDYMKAYGRTILNTESISPIIILSFADISFETFRGFEKF